MRHKKYFSKRARAFGHSFKRSARSKTGSINLVGTVIAAGAYGAARGYLSSWMAPVTSKIPGGIYADNIALGAVCYAGAKWGPSWLKGVAKSGLIVEAALAGSDLANGMIGSSSSNSGYALG